MFFKLCLGFIAWYNIYVIDKDARKWSNSAIQSTIFNSMINNSSLRPIKQFIVQDNIDWTFTWEWINNNPLDTPCSEKLSIIQGRKIKKCTFTHPTVCGYSTA
ncbi:hypothetical protein RhiirC2_786590 [Rhizophagus irregularis]|uniref:Uncharacterized protein n=1 Tax=Rhizophagus irregularis TaxID=588596 RepID=A0A2N1MU13_9GLOM|nr:hypothetical protein RhiirC2_786590 [Rhizophagus irregularis]